MKRFTKKQLEIMKILWAADSPLIASYIVKKSPTLNSKALISKQLSCKDTINLGDEGYYSLLKDFIELKNAKAIEIAYYVFIKPRAAISVYAGNGGAYVFGTPGTVIGGLKIRYRS